MSAEPSKLPATAAEWRKQIERAGLQGKSIFDLDTYDSGSKITHKQFLLLRVIWVKEGQSVFSRTHQNWIPTHEYNEAKRLLKASPCWQRYLASFERTAVDLRGKEFPDLGTFSLVREGQCEVERIAHSEDPSESLKFSPVAHRTRSRTALENRAQEPSTPTPKPARPAPVTPKNFMKSVDLPEAGSSDTPFPPESSTAKKSDILSPWSPVSPEAAVYLTATPDEQIVNMALILFLKAATVHFVGNSEWSIQRKAFIIGDKGDKGFEARVDGVLFRNTDDAIMAILEVKPFVRGKKEAAIQRQEAAQMAAWISNSLEASDTGTHTTYVRP
jgi:hypothetical protein